MSARGTLCAWFSRIDVLPQQLLFTGCWHGYDKLFSVWLIASDTSSVLLLMREIIEQITAGSPMVGTPLI